MSDQQQQPYGQNPSVQTQQPPVYGQPQYGGPNYMPPPQPKKKGIFSKKRTWFFIVALVIVISIIANANKGGASSSTDTITTSQNSAGTSNQSSSSAQPTTAPTKATTWTTTQTFTGNGTKKTAVFHVGDDWKIVWSCDPASFDGGEYNVMVDVKNSDTTEVDPAAVNTICKTGNIGDSTEEHQGGDVYLDINSEGSWKIQVQELK